MLMRWLGHRLMCKDVSRLVSRAQDGTLPFGERLKGIQRIHKPLRVHGMVRKIAFKRGRAFAFPGRAQQPCPFRFACSRRDPGILAAFGEQR